MNGLTFKRLKYLPKVLTEVIEDCKRIAIRLNVLIAIEIDSWGELFWRTNEQWITIWILGERNRSSSHNPDPIRLSTVIPMSICKSMHCIQCWIFHCLAILLLNEWKRWMETMNESLTSEIPKAKPITVKQNQVAKQSEASFHYPVAFQRPKLHSIWIISHCSLGLAREHTKCIQNDEGLKSKLLKLLTWRDLREIQKARLLKSWSNWSNGVVK